MAEIRHCILKRLLTTYWRPTRRALRFRPELGPGLYPGLKRRVTGRVRRAFHRERQPTLTPNEEENGRSERAEFAEH